MKPADDVVERVMLSDGVHFILHPGQFALGSTLERVLVPSDVVARIEGKSSLARYGLLIHSTAGFVDPGWDGFARKVPTFRERGRFHPKSIAVKLCCCPFPISSPSIGLKSITAPK